MIHSSPPFDGCRDAQSGWIYQTIGMAHTYSRLVQAKAKSKLPYNRDPIIVNSDWIGFNKSETNQACEAGTV
jgi:hypothetical protein